MSPRRRRQLGLCPVCRKPTICRIWVEQRDVWVHQILEVEDSGQVIIYGCDARRGVPLRLKRIKDALDELP